MKPLIVLLVSFVISLFVIKLLRGNFDYSLSGRIAMAIMLLFTAIAHFAFSKGMEMMLPDFIPYKKALIYFTGLVEIAAAVGLLAPGLTTLTGWLLILFFILILPANIYSAINKIDYQTGTKNGSDIKYLWFRIPLQILFITWTWFVAIYNN